MIKNENLIHVMNPQITGCAFFLMSHTGKSEMPILPSGKLREPQSDLTSETNTDYQRYNAQIYTTHIQHTYYSNDHSSHEIIKMNSVFLQGHVSTNTQQENIVIVSKTDVMSVVMSGDFTCGIL